MGMLILIYAKTKLQPLHGGPRDGLRYMNDRDKMQVTLELNRIHYHIGGTNEMVKAAKHSISPGSVRHDNDERGRAVMVEQDQNKDWSKGQMQRMRKPGRIASKT